MGLGLGKLFSGGAGELVESVGGVLDNLTTSNHIDHGTTGLLPSTYKQACRFAVAGLERDPRVLAHCCTEIILMGNYSTRVLACICKL